MKADIFKIDDPIIRKFISYIRSLDVNNILKLLFDSNTTCINIQQDIQEDRHRVIQQQFNQQEYVEHYQHKNISTFYK